MKVQTSRKGGFTLVEIMIVVAIIGLLAAIAIPNFVKARASAQKNSCTSNLKVIDGAIQQWALENKKVETATVSLADTTLLSYFKGSVAPTCPSTGTAYTVSTVAVGSACGTTPSLGHTL